MSAIGTIFKKKWFRRTLVIVASLLFVTVLVFFLVLPKIASSVLTNMLGVPVSIESISVSPFGIDATVRGIEVGQPEGFGEEPLLSLDAVKVYGISGLLSGKYQISDLKLEGFKVRLINNQEQEFNIASIIETLSSEEEAEDETEESEMVALLKHFQIEGLAVSYIDYSLGEGDEAFQMDMIDGKVEATRLAMGTWPDLEPGEMDFSAKLDQEGELESDITMYARFGQLVNGLIDMDSVTRISALRYDTLSPAIPASASVALGGGGIQLEMISQLAGEKIHVAGEVKTSGKSHYNMKATGTLEAPEIDLPKKLLSVTSRMTGSVGRVLNSAWSGTGEILSGAAGTVKTVGKETIGAVGSLAKGTGKSLAGVLKGDGEEVKSGLGEATGGTGGHLVDAVTDSTKEIAESGAGTFKAIAEDPRFIKWLEEQAAKHEQLAKEDKESLIAKPFPPQIEAGKKSDK